MPAAFGNPRTSYSFECCRAAYFFSMDSSTLLASLTGFLRLESSDQSLLSLRFDELLLLSLRFDKLSLSMSRSSGRRLRI